MIDKNPDNQPEFIVPINVVEMVQCTDEDTCPEDGFFWGCPNCLTDDYFSDVWYQGALTTPDELKQYEQSDIWVDQAIEAYTTFTNRTENGLLAIDMLIEELQRIRNGETVYKTDDI